MVNCLPPSQISAFSLASAGEKDVHDSTSPRSAELLSNDVSYSLQKKSADVDERFDIRSISPTK
jgi:hypothetical protein